MKIKDLGSLKLFLGLEIARSSKGLSVNQKKYALEILEAIGYLASKLATTPMDRSLKLQQASTLLSDPSSYRGLIGRLLYLTTIRSNLSYDLQLLNQYLAAPTETHMKAVHRILRYIKASSGIGLFLLANSPIQLRSFNDSDRVGCSDTRRSVTRFCIYLVIL